MRIGWRTNGTTSELSDGRPFKAPAFRSIRQVLVQEEVSRGLATAIIIQAPKLPSN